MSAFDFDSLEYEEGQKFQPLVLHEDAKIRPNEGAGGPMDRVLMEGHHAMAKALVLFGPGVLVLPIVGHISGLQGRDALHYDAYAAHEAGVGGILERNTLEEKFGSLDPVTIADEFSMGDQALNSYIASLDDDILHKQVLRLQYWRDDADRRIRTLERRVACSFLGIDGCSMSASAVHKAFKRKALELHPDKGGDAERFLLLQEMKDQLLEACEEEGKIQKKEKGDDEEEREEEKELEARRKKFQEMKSSAEEDIRNLLEKGTQADRSLHEQARRDQHNNALSVWRKVQLLMEGIWKSNPVVPSGEALQSLKKFIEHFVSTKLSKLRHGDISGAQRVFHKFLDQGAEVICEAAAADSAATVSLVAMQVNHQLIARSGGSKAISLRCSALLEAIQNLSKTVTLFLEPIEEAFGCQSSTHSQEKSVAHEVDFNKENQNTDNIASTKEKDITSGIKDDLTGDSNELPTGTGLPSARVLGMAEKSDEPQGLEPSFNGSQQKWSNESKVEAEQYKNATQGHKEGCQTGSEPVFHPPPRLHEGEMSTEDTVEKIETAPPPICAASEEPLEEPLPTKPQQRKSPFLEHCLIVQSRSSKYDTALGEMRRHSEVKQAVEAEQSEELTLVSKTWDPNFDHPCAGEQKEDGSAIFCEACDEFIQCFEPFDAGAFELHCLTECIMRPRH